MNKLTIYTNELLGILSNYLSLKFGKKIQVKVEKNIYKSQHMIVKWAWIWC